MSNLDKESSQSSDVIEIGNFIRTLPCGREQEYSLLQEVRTGHTFAVEGSYVEAELPVTSPYGSGVLNFDGARLDSGTRQSNNSVLFQCTINDWQCGEVADDQIAAEFLDDYTFCVQRSSVSNALFFTIWPKSLGDAVLSTGDTEITLNGLAGVIEVRSGKPAISLGLHDQDLFLHVESDVSEGLFVHSDHCPRFDSKMPEHRNVKLKSNGVMVSGTHYPGSEENWLEEARKQIILSHAVNAGKETEGDYQIGQGYIYPNAMAIELALDHGEDEAREHIKFIVNFHENSTLVSSVSKAS